MQLSAWGGAKNSRNYLALEIIRDKFLNVQQRLLISDRNLKEKTLDLQKQINNNVNFDEFTLGLGSWFDDLERKIDVWKGQI